MRISDWSSDVCSSDLFGVLKQEERLRHLLADSFGATMIIMPNGIVRYVAPSIQHILGYTEQELLGTNIRSLEHAEERRQVGAFVRAMTTDGTSKRMELRLRPADGPYPTIGQASCRACVCPYV